MTFWTPQVIPCSREVVRCLKDPLPALALGSKSGYIEGIASSAGARLTSTCCLSSATFLAWFRIPAFSSSLQHRVRMTIISLQVREKLRLRCSNSSLNFWGVLGIWAQLFLALGNVLHRERNMNVVPLLGGRFCLRMTFPSVEDKAYFLIVNPWGRGHMEAEPRRWWMTSLQIPWLLGPASWLPGPSSRLPGVSYPPFQWLLCWSRGGHEKVKGIFCIRPC